MEESIQVSYTVRGEVWEWLSKGERNRVEVIQSVDVWIVITIYAYRIMCIKYLDWANQLCTVHIDERPDGVRRSTAHARAQL